MTASVPRGRRAGLDDAAGIAFVYFTAWEETYRGIIPDEILDGRAPINKRSAMWRSYLERALGDLFVAETDGAVVGFGACAAGRDPVLGAGEISAICVLAAQQRRGLGRGLGAECL